MELRKKKNYVRNIIVYTIITTVILCSVLYMMFNYINKKTKEEAYETLHLQTYTLKENINVQITSDMENLTTLAKLASSLYKEGRDYSLLFDSFEPIGIIEDIGVLMPDNTFVTKMGIFDAGAYIDYEKESVKGPYVSGKIKDITVEDKDIVRLCSPILSNGKTVALLYGVVDLKKFAERYHTLAKAHNAELYIIEQENGNIIINTYNKDYLNISGLSDNKFKDGFSYDILKKDITEGKSGFSVFGRKDYSGYTYAHYAPLKIEGWQIMMSMPEKIVLSFARSMWDVMVQFFIFIFIVLMFYIFLIFLTERKQSNHNLISSKIRKLLLEINQQDSSVTDSLENIAKYSKAKSAFYVDTDGEDYDYVMPQYGYEIFTQEEKDYVSNELLRYTEKERQGRNVSVLFFNFSASGKNEGFEELCDFLKAHDVSLISFVTIENKKENVAILGVIDSKKSIGVSVLLKDISVCFSMAIYNKKYLKNTELTAVTDSLTGLYNRVAYKNDIIRFENNLKENFACIYIDVNELHIINNKYGHAAGDTMLVFIADALKEEFYNTGLYRVGGDEFLIFSEEYDKKTLLRKLDNVTKKAESQNYHISIGVGFMQDGDNLLDIIKVAEKLMYERKAEYYQQKEEKTNSMSKNESVEHILTGIPEVDATLDVLGTHYYGIYCVNLKDDSFRRVIMSSSYKSILDENESLFSKSLSRYIHEMVHSDYHRSLSMFLNYDILKKQLSDGEIPVVTYKRLDGEAIRLTIYKHSELYNALNETVWVFECI